MSKKYDDFAVDLRVIRLNMERGSISAKDYEGFLKSLPDLSDQMEEIPAYEEPAESSDLTFSAA